MPTVTVADIAVEKIVLVYISYGTENTVGVEFFMSPLHREVTPISHFVSVRVHRVHVRLVSREIERRKGEEKMPLNEIATTIHP